MPNLSENLDCQRQRLCTEPTSLQDSSLDTSIFLDLLDWCKGRKLSAIRRLVILWKQGRLAQFFFGQIYLSYVAKYRYNRQSLSAELLIKNLISGNLNLATTDTYLRIATHWAASNDARTDCSWPAHSKATSTPTQLRLQPPFGRGHPSGECRWHHERDPRWIANFRTAGLELRATFHCGGRHFHPRWRRKAKTDGRSFCTGPRLPRDNDTAVLV